MNQAMFSLKSSLKLGSQADAVWLLQAMLAALSRHYINLARPALNGTYDEFTRQAVLRVQRACGLPDTGVTDEKTWNEIVQMFCCWQ